MQGAAPYQTASSSAGSAQSLRAAGISMYASRSAPELAAERRNSGSSDRTSSDFKDIAKPKLADFQPSSSLSPEFWPSSFRRSLNGQFRQQHVFRGNWSNLEGHHSPSRGAEGNLSALNGGGVIVQRRGAGALWRPDDYRYSISNKGRLVTAEQHRHNQHSPTR